MPTKVVKLELSEELQPIEGLENYDGVCALVQHQQQAVGWIYIAKTGIQPSISVLQIWDAINNQISWATVLTVVGNKVTPPPKIECRLSPISIVVCTRDRPHLLEGCLNALVSLDYRDYEIIVVDNAPFTEATAQLVAKYPARYVREDRPGLSWARNAGIAHARHDIIAFTNDNARPDNNWLNAIVHAFAEPEVLAVTGLIVPKELETDAQIQFEYGYGFGSNQLKHRIFRRANLTNQALLWAENFGHGVNMAFHRYAFTAVGEFDVSLGAGTPVGGGSDLEMLHRLIIGGYTLVYEPRAFVWHIHKSDLTSLKTTAFNRGKSLGAYILACSHKKTVRGRSRLYFTFQKAKLLLNRFYKPGKLSRFYVLLELVGFLLSPLVYQASKMRARQIANQPISIQTNDHVEFIDIQNIRNHA